MILSQTAVHEYLLKSSSRWTCFNFRLSTMQAALPTLFFLTTSSELACSSEPLLGLALSMFSLIHAVPKVMSVARLVTVRKLALAIPCSNWTSRRTTSLTFNCFFVADCKRIAFTVTAFLVQARGGQFSSYWFWPAPVSKTAANFFLLRRCVLEPWLYNFWIS